jgi:hypothetical protein
MTRGKETASAIVKHLVDPKLQLQEEARLANRAIAYKRHAQHLSPFSDNKNLSMP